MDEKRKKHIDKIFSDQDFVLSLLKLKTPEEVQAAFKKKDWELSQTDALAICDQLKSYSLGDDSGALSSEELESVSGGVIPIFISPPRRPSLL